VVSTFWNFSRFLLTTARSSLVDGVPRCESNTLVRATACAVSALFATLELGSSFFVAVHEDHGFFVTWIAVLPHIFTPFVLFEVEIGESPDS